MRMNRIFSIVALAAAIVVAAVPSDAASKRKKKKDSKTEKVDTVKKLTEYEKIFKDKKKETAESFMKVHLLDKKTYIVELPKDMVGRDMLITSAVDRTSDGQGAATGFKSLKSIHVAFDKVDTLILLKEVDSYLFSTSDKSSESALDKSHTGAVIATFPIKTMSPDSSAYVFDMTKYLASYDKRLDPADPYGAASFGGLLTTNLSHKSQLSMPYGVEAYPDNISMLSYETYQMAMSLGQLPAMSDDADNLTVLLRRNFLLLPEDPAPMRLADPRVGVTPVSRVRYSDDKGSKEKWFAKRWNLEDGKKLVFYVDTLFTEPFAKAITDGILAWNDAFRQMGRGDVIEVKPYPSDDPDFSPNDLRYSCVRHEVISSETLRSNSWTDPRSGEIICASITVPFDVLLGIHAALLMEIGEVDTELKTVKHTAPVLFDALQAKITREVGKCLGLDENLAASGAVPADSLRSPSFTSRYGLSASIMDELSANYFAKPGDKERGVCLVQTNIGEYDKYAINWLYCDVPGAVTPEDEVPYLEMLISSSKDDPMCRYIRKPSYSDVRRTWEPRCVSEDLGDDPFRSLDERLATLRSNMAALDSWAVTEDYDYSFRPYLNAEVILPVAYALLDILKYTGGIYTHEKFDGDEFPSYEVVDEQLQKKALMKFIDCVENLDWMDESQAWRDIFFVRSFGDYTHAMLVSEFPIVFYRLAVSEVKSDDTYTLVEAYEDILDRILRDVKSGKPTAKKDILFQYQMLGLIMRNSNINPQVPGGAGAIAANVRAHNLNLPEVEVSGFQPLPAYDFAFTAENDYRLYRKLNEVRNVYAKAAKTAKDKFLREQYDYFVMAIDRALSLD